MYKLYSMQRSGNSYKVRLALALLNAPYQRDRDRHPARRKPHAGFSGQESERTGAAAGSRRRTLPRRVQRHPLVCRRRHAAGAGIADRARRSAAMDVLRTARAGAEYRRRLFLAVAGQGRPRPADPRAGGLDGARLCGVAGDGKSPQDPRTISPRASSRSPTSRSMATPMSPTAATTISRPSPRSAPGCAGSSRPPALSAWIGGPTPGPTRLRAFPPEA